MLGVVEKEKKEVKKHPVYDNPLDLFYRGKPEIHRVVEFGVDERMENALNYLRNTQGLWDEQDVIRFALARAYTDLYDHGVEKDYKTEQTRKLMLDNEEKRRRLFNEDGSKK